MVSEIAVGEAIHQSVAKSIETGGGSGLRNAILRGGAGRVEWRHARDGCGPGEGGTVRTGKIDMELPQIQNAGTNIHIHQEVGGAARGRSGAIEVSGEQAVICSRKLEAHARRSNGAAEHGAAVEGAGSGPRKGAAVLEHIKCHVVAVGPNTNLGIVVNVGTETIRPHIVGAGWVRGG